MATPAFPYAVDSVTIFAKHLLDKGDKIAFNCKATAFASTITNIDQTTAAWKLSMDVASPGSFTDCAKVVTGPGGLIGLIVAIVQGAVLILLGPTIMLYGPTMPRFTSLIKAIVVSSYLLLINSIVSVNAFTGFTVFERAVTFFVSTLTVTYTSLNNPGAKAKAAGFALGTMIAVPFCAFVSELLYTHAIGCSGFGEKKEWFPNGEPLGCDLDSASFQGAFQGMQFLKWLIITVSAYYGKKTMNFSTATVGASMLVKGIIDLTKAIGFQVAPDDAAKLLVAITPIRAWVTYGVALAGFLCHRYLIEQVDVPDSEPPKKKWIKKAKQPMVMMPQNLISKLCVKVDGFLERNLETLKDGGKGALVRSMTRKSTPKKEGAKPDSVEIDVAKEAAPAAAPATEAKTFREGGDITA